MLAIVLLTVAQGNARAELPPLLSWRAPQGCGDELAIRRRIGELALPDAEVRQDPYAIADVTNGEGGLVAHITLKTADGVSTRTRRAATCDELAESVAQLVAMAWRSSFHGPKLLDWQAPDECPDRLEVRAQIIRRVSRRTASTAPMASVEVASDSGGYRAVVRLQSGETFETREVRGATCAEAADAVAWMIALTWVPRVHTTDRTSSAQSVTELPSSWHPHAALRSVFDAGSLPGADAGIAIALGTTHDSGLDVEVAGTLWANRFDALMDGSPAGADVTLSALSAQGCVSRWFACVGFEAGTIQASAVQLQDGRTASLLWLAATAGARVRHPLTRTLRVILDAGVVVPLARPEFTFDGGGIVFRSAPVAARAGLALEFAPFE